MIFFAGKTLTGTETRAKTIDYHAISNAIGINCFHGTFNVQCLESPPYENMQYRKIGIYTLYPCSVATAEMIKNESDPVPGYILRIDEEKYPGYFLEIVSPFHIRKQLKIEKWPSISVEVGINLPTNGTKEQ